MLVSHDTAEGLFVVAKGHPKKKLKASDFPGLDASLIREELRLSPSKKLLVLFMWVHDEELRLFKMHPEVLSWDVTKSTNREKRDLLMATGKDGNGRCDIVTCWNPLESVATEPRSYGVSS